MMKNVINMNQLQPIVQKMLYKNDNTNLHFTLRKIIYFIILRNFIING